MGVKTHILVLEDDPDLREELTDLLTEEGYAVSAAGRGEDAVRLAGEIPFDLVIADVRMDGMDGLEALERMRGQDSARMVITGYASEADSIRAIRLGVDEYLKKPFSMRDFLDRVAALLQQRRLNRERQEAERAARRLTRSALESLAGVLDGADGGARVRAGRLASLLASRLGLDREAASEVGTAALVASMGEAARIADADPRLRAVADAVEERWDGGGPEGLAGADIPLEARVTAVAVEAAERPPQAAESLAREFPGRFDPRVLEALGSITSEEPVAEADASRIRGLLSLGEALHGRGDGESARRAFRQVVRDAGGSREAIAALLRLAAMAVGDRRAEEGASLAGDAVGRARRLGPIAAASAALEAGTVLIEARPDDARPLLEEAARLGEEMRLPVVSAAARLGMARLGASGDVDPALGLLLQSRHATELADASWWLLPLVLQRAADAPQGVAAKAAQRLARNTPRNLLRALDGGRLSPAARRAAAAALAEIPGELARAALQRLAADEDTGVRRAATVALQATSAGAELPLVRICALGPMEVYRGDERVEEKTFRTQKIRLLLAYLAAHADRPVPEERLIEEFWPGDGDKGRNSLYNATSVLRKALDPGSETSRNRYILRVGDALQFDPEIPLWHDAEQLERAWTDGQRFDAEKRVSEASDQFRRMALLYRGPYLDGCYMDWAIDRRNRLEQNVLSAMVRVSEVSLDAGRPKEALEYAGRVLDIDPCHQESHWVAMQAYLASGRPEEAIRQFERCEKNLRREMGIDPLIKLVETYHRARLG